MPLALSTLFIAMASVQFGASLAKGLFPVLGPNGTTAWRLTVAALIMMTVARPWKHPFPRSQWPTIIRYGLALGLMNILFYLAIARIPLGVAVALEFTGPLGVAIYASRRAVDVVWIIFAVAGLGLLYPWSPGSSLDLVGVAYALGAGLCWGLYIVFGQRMGKEMHGTQGVALGMTVAALVALPVGLAQNGLALWQPTLLVSAILVGLFSSAIPYSLEMIALRRIPPATFGILMSLEPALAALMGWLFLQERLTPNEILAICFIISASLGSTLTSVKRKPSL